MANRARILLTPELVCELLHLPAGTEILGSGLHHREVEIFVSHPDLAEAQRIEGDPLPIARPRFRQQAAVVFMDWGQR